MCPLPQSPCNNERCKFGSDKKTENDNWMDVPGTENKYSCAEKIPKSIADDPEEDYRSMCFPLLKINGTDYAVVDLRSHDITYLKDCMLIRWRGCDEVDEPAKG